MPAIDDVMNVTSKITTHVPDDVNDDTKSFIAIYAGIGIGLVVMATCILLCCRELNRRRLESELMEELARKEIIKRSVHLKLQQMTRSNSSKSFLEHMELKVPYVTFGEVTKISPSPSFVELHHRNHSHPNLHPYHHLDDEGDEGNQKQHHHHQHHHHHHHHHHERHNGSSGGSHNHAHHTRTLGHIQTGADSEELNQSLIKSHHHHHHAGNLHGMRRSSSVFSFLRGKLFPQPTPRSRTSSDSSSSNSTEEDFVQVKMEDLSA